MTTRDPVERVMELLTDQHLTGEHIYEAAQLLQDCQLRMIDGTMTGNEVFNAIEQAVRLLDVALGMSPDETTS